MYPGRGLVLLALAFLLSGCARDPLERTVSVPNASRFAAWRARIESDGSADLRRQVGEALAEIRTNFAGNRELKRIMGDKIESGTEPLDEALRQRVDGRPLREVLQLGYELRVRRLKEELAGLEDAIHKNMQLLTAPGDYESRRHLDGIRDRQLKRVDQYRADLSAAEKQLEPLLDKTGHPLIEIPVSPDQLDLQPQRKG